tara:strand:- start:133 stop:738 length:606 start_codon:yes stop_codon:yes gene_type:complete
MVYYFTRKKRNKKCKKKHDSCKNRCRSPCRLNNKKYKNLHKKCLGKAKGIGMMHKKNNIRVLLDLPEINDLIPELGVNVEDSGDNIKTKTTKYNYIIQLTYSKKTSQLDIRNIIQYCLQRGKEFGFLNGREYTTKLNKIITNTKHYSKTKNNVFIYLTTIHRDSNDKYNNIEQIKKSVISELRQCIKNTKYKLKNIVIHNK